VLRVISLILVRKLTLPGQPRLVPKNCAWQLVRKSRNVQSINLSLNHLHYPHYQLTAARESSICLSPSTGFGSTFALPVPNNILRTSSQPASPMRESSEPPSRSPRFRLTPEHPSSAFAVLTYPHRTAQPAVPDLLYTRG